MRLSALSLCAVLAAGTLSAHASTLAGTWYLENAYVNGFALTGTVTLNGSGKVTAVDLTYNDPLYAGSQYSPADPEFTVVSAANTFSMVSQSYPNEPGTQPGGQITFYFDTTPSAGGAGTYSPAGTLTVCTSNQACGGDGTQVSNLATNNYYNQDVPPYGQSETGVSGNIVGSPSATTNPYLTLTPPAAVTPEPSSLALLGTGLLGAAGFLRRRFVKA